ncbi:DNA polymerase III subunit delta' [Sneathiella sp. HT1-7]|uniref:DNA polymerase III subunit delta' n=1 Tax=Sneathiella sp. HT1-7 TaxID=2887192 RepID=UPI001D159717|nr:DNA polymerase III subunit delta' [Sneathiella sp. HT1-7]MCC3306054.1 DNA polymerase III subunit delta' [Sneathiella sp. HT1-7]
MTDLPQSDKLDGYPHPRDTTHLIGHEEAEERFLDNFMSGRFHHAWLITGARGVGKATFAYRAAKFLLSQQAGGGGGLFGPPETLDVPEDDPALALMHAGSHPGLAVLRRQYDTKGKKFYTAIRVDDVRTLSPFFQLTASEGSWRIVIVDSVDDMNPSAANAILKTLEEPPKKTLFLLLSHTPAGLLPTIRSRCRQLALRPLDDANMRKVLAPHCETLSPEQLDMLLTLSEGSPGKALRLLEAGGLEIFTALLDIFKEYPRLDAEKLHALADKSGLKDGETRYRSVCEIYPWWLTRLVRAASEDFAGNNLIAGEAEIMKQMISRHSPSDWAQLWEKGNELIKRADSINLDRKQVVLNLFLNVERMGR